MSSLRAPLNQTCAPYRSPFHGKFVSESEYEDCVSDYDHARETWQGLQEPCPYCDPSDECDCHTSETIMLSSGYAEVYQYGDVIGRGVKFNVAE